MSSCASRVLVLLLVVAASAGCRTPASERCREYCSRGADCAIPADNKAFDEAEFPILPFNHQPVNFPARLHPVTPR